MIIETSGEPGQVENAIAARRVRRPFLLTACWGYLIMVITVWLVMRQLGDRSWMATVLLLAPRWPYAVPLVALWPWALVARRWWMAGVTGLSTGVVLLGILGVRWSFPAGSERGDLRLVTCNVHRQQMDADELAKFLAETDPDVIALQGWSDMNHESVFATGRWNVRRVGELLLASHFPIGSITPVDLSDAPGVPAGERGAAALFEVHAPRGSVYVMNMHLASPHVGLTTFSEDAGRKLSENIRRREQESGIVQQQASLVSGPLVLAGDFNTTDDSAMFRKHWHGYADAFAERGSGIGYTYLINHTQLRIDHVLANESWRFLRCWVGPDVGSPHRPLAVDVTYR